MKKAKPARKKSRKSNDCEWVRRFFEVPIEEMLPIQTKLGCLPKGAYFTIPKDELCQLDNSGEVIDHVLDGTKSVKIRLKGTGEWTPDYFPVSSEVKVKFQRQDMRIPIEEWWSGDMDINWVHAPCQIKSTPSTQKKRESDPDAPAKTVTKKSGFGKAKTLCFGLPVTAVLRWMGSDGWDYEEARDALATLKIFPSDNTIKNQLRDGGAKQHKYGDVPQLTDKQIKELYAASGMGD